MTKKGADHLSTRTVRKSLLPNFHTLSDTLENNDESSLTLEAETIINDAYESKATDIHLDPYSDSYHIRLRIDGLLHDAAKLSLDQGHRIVNQIKTLCNLNPLPSVKAEEGSYFFSREQNQLDIRITAVPCASGTKLAVRLLLPPDTIKEIDSLGLHNEEIEKIDDWLTATSGMLLVAGPTGSGKTTSLYVLLHKLKMAESHVITLEEPIEYQISGINQIQINNENGLDMSTGTEALLRLDPDFVLLGEIRNTISANAAINITSSGRSLMATLHSKDAISTISTLRNMGLDDFDIAANLSFVIAQRLVRKLCPHCKEQVSFDQNIQHWLDKADIKPPKKMWIANGCDSCKNIGYSGRTGIFEVWRLSEKDRRMIIDHEDEFNLRKSFYQSNNLRMADDALEKANEGITSYEELIRKGVFS